MIKMTETVKHGRHQTEWITISVDEYESMRRTIEVLSDRDLMYQIEEGKRADIKIRNFEELAKELGI
jgi:PHD/YefM family antitoxin component YafN of YafNO toxin-antitoxin module